MKTKLIAASVASLPLVAFLAYGASYVAALLK